MIPQISHRCDVCWDIGLVMEGDLIKECACRSKTPRRARPQNDHPNASMPSPAALGVVLLILGFWFFVGLFIGYGIGHN